MTSETNLRKQKDNNPMSALKEKDSKKEREVSPAADSVKFSVWFSRHLKSHKKLQPHHMAEILAFFKNNGLSEEENVTSYDAMLKTFGF